jgi:hypothetical protein
MGPRTKLGLGVTLAWIIIEAAIAGTGAAGKALVLLTCTPMLVLGGIYFLLTLRYWRTRDPAWRP